MNNAVSECIHFIRGERVMLDVDLARLYGVRTQRLNQQVRRNKARFPPVFMFQLTPQEWRDMCLQNASTSPGRRRKDNPPLAFTEHGCLMLSNVLKSPRAVEVSVLIVQAFVRLRATLAYSQELARRVDELEGKLSEQLGRHEGVLHGHNKAIRQILAEIRRLTAFPEPPKRGISFTAKW